MKTKSATGKSRHGKTAPNQIKLSCKVDMNTWRRVGKKAASEEKDVAAYLRGLIMEAVWDVPLSKEDYAIIQQQMDSRNTER